MNQSRTMGDASLNQLTAMAEATTEALPTSGLAANQFGGPSSNTGPERSANLRAHWFARRSVLLVMTCCIGGTTGASYQFIGSRGLESESRKKTELRIAALEQSSVELRILLAASQPGRPENQRAAKELLEAVRARKLPTIIKAEVVSQAGRSFLEAAAVVPSAWPVAIDYINHHSTMLPWYSSNVRELSARSLPECLALPGYAQSPASSVGTGLHPLRYEHCVLDLDDSRLSDRKYAAGIIVTDGLVRYVGRTAHLRGRFQNCIFEFSSYEKPQAAVRLLADLVLRSPADADASF